MKKLGLLFLVGVGLLIAGCSLLMDGGGKGAEPGELAVTASPSYGGTVTRSPDLTGYEPGTAVTLTATPAYGYVFGRWEGDATGSENPTTIKMNGGKSVTAFFGYDKNRLTVAMGYYTAVVNNPYGQQFTGASCGSVSISPNQAVYAYGTAVTLTASPSSDYQFARWEYGTINQWGGDGGFVTLSEDPVTMITMDSDKVVLAVFKPVNPVIGLSRAGIYVYSYEIYPLQSFQIGITNDGVGALSGLSVNFPGGKPKWLSAALSESSAPATLTVTFENSLQATAQSIPEGAEVESVIQITSPVAMNSPQNVSVTVKHIPMPAPPQPAPQPAPTPPLRPPGPIQPAFPEKVICAELHRQGLMDESIWKADEAFGKYLRDNQSDVLLGYQVWAKPVVKWMQKSKVFTNLAAKVVTPWSYEMAYRMGARDKGSFAGKILMDVGVPVCRTIGRVAIWVENMAFLGVARDHAAP